MRKTKYLFLILFISSTFFIWQAGTVLSASANKPSDNPPDDLNIKTVDANGVHAWLVPVDKPEACVLLIHGVRSNKSSMLARARFLQKEGFASLAIDLQAHGETPGEFISFGYLESISAKKAVDYMRSHLACKRIVALGQSLGGAASVLGDFPLNVDAFILEGVYSRIETAVFNRMKVKTGVFAHIVAPLLYFQIPLRLDVELAKLQPVEAIKKINAPVLIMAGANDRRTTVVETREIFENAPDPKKLQLFKNAKHVDLYRFEPEKYQQTVLEFIKTSILHK